MILQRQPCRRAAQRRSLVCNSCWDGTHASSDAVRRKHSEALQGMGGFGQRIVCCLPPDLQPVLEALACRLITVPAIKKEIKKEDSKALKQVRGQRPAVRQLSRLYAQPKAVQRIGAWMGRQGPTPCS